LAANSVFPDWLQSLLLLLFIGLAIVLAIQQANELKKIQKSSNKKVYTVIECGDKERTRQFKEGDYVGAKVPCNGEGEGRITKIYAVVPEDKSKKPMKT
jgi:uncharacterized membrane protein